ncbi:BglII/BstYI family type II restriction endonuclease [Propionibacterium australiense]|uniref:Type II site-specific deoxyribonuclease n=1 Tax=Propionibacterium australiense TaxID=119981 RepID=A0A383S7U3_9ACTN|nr:BglII/BstYI family type II restriction endonuclease [Propionibacterium australiense]RLP08517.1 hypothetical protein D9T14_08535 [Propionibacterium australiense]RLP08586.1 hypothetical protein D7U36_09080 [Propionibacterium australiense]SYZ33632.1 type II site-specific deoxyribonuclease [Propionibacterium australiense]VEH88835.1 Restriction endonuclease BglII [Propionibacterium australiense]
MREQPVPEIADTVLPGVVAAPTIADLPTGYTYGVTRYADVILANAFPTLFAEIVHSLSIYEIDFQAEIIQRGGSRAPHTKRFDESLYAQGWNKHNVTIEKRIDNQPIFKTPTHEIDVFKLDEGSWYPGVAVEMEWNNKDPFYHRDLNNFSGLHNEGVIAVGVIVTRGPKAAGQARSRRRRRPLPEIRLRSLNHSLGQARADRQSRWRRAVLPFPDRHRRRACHQLAATPELIHKAAHDDSYSQIPASRLCSPPSCVKIY